LGNKGGVSLGGGEMLGKCALLLPESLQATGGPIGNWEGKGGKEERKGIRKIFNRAREEGGRVKSSANLRGTVKRLLERSADETGKETLTNGGDSQRSRR